MAGCPPGCPNVCAIGDCVEPTEAPKWDGYRRCWSPLGSMCAEFIEGGQGGSKKIVGSPDNLCSEARDAANWV